MTGLEAIGVQEIWTLGCSEIAAIKVLCDTHGAALGRSGLGRSNSHGAHFDTECRSKALER